MVNTCEGGLIGREAEMEWVCARVQKPGAKVLIQGFMGYGKTALAGECAKELQSGALQQCLFGFLRGASVAAAGQDLVAFGRQVSAAVRFHGTEVQEALKATQAWLQNPENRWCLLVDDVRDPSLLQELKLV